MLDVGCGKGFSTLAYAMLAGNLEAKFKMTGVDYHSHFMERASLNNQLYAAHLKGPVKFKPLDFLNDSLHEQFDVMTFGFEISLDILRKKQDLFKHGAHILVPLSEVDGEGNLLGLE